MDLDDGGAKRIRRLRELRDEVVALLRDVPSAGPRLERLLAARFKGTDELSQLVDATLQAGVVAAPR